MAKFFAVKEKKTGKYLSRARFDPSWDTAFQLDHPEGWDSIEAAERIAKLHDGEVITFTCEE